MQLLVPVILPIQTGSESHFLTLNMVLFALRDALRFLEFLINVSNPLLYDRWVKFLLKVLPKINYTDFLI